MKALIYLGAVVSLVSLTGCGVRLDRFVVPDVGEAQWDVESQSWRVTMSSSGGTGYPPENRELRQSGESSVLQSTLPDMDWLEDLVSGLEVGWIIGYEDPCSWTSQEDTVHILDQDLRNAQVQLKAYPVSQMSAELRSKIKKMLPRLNRLIDFLRSEQPEAAAYRAQLVEKLSKACAEKKAGSAK